MSFATKVCQLYVVIAVPQKGKEKGKKEHGTFSSS